MTYSTLNLKLTSLSVDPRILQHRNEASFVFQDTRFYLSPGSWAILVLYAYNFMDYPVDFLSILWSNLYACLFKNLRQMPEVTRHW